MRLLLMTVFIIPIFYFSAPAQNTGKITGTVKSSNQKSSIGEGTTVSLLRGKDSSTISSSLLEQNRSFSFDNIAYGRYLVSVTAMGFHTAYSPVITITATNAAVQLPAIQLHWKARTIYGVTVSTKKPLGLASRFFKTKVL